MSDPTDPASPSTAPANPSPAPTTFDAAAIRKLFDPANANVLRGLVASLGQKDGLIVSLALVGMFVGFFAHRLTWDQIQNPLVAILVAFLGAHGYATGKKHEAIGNVAAKSVVDGSKSEW